MINARNFIDCYFCNIYKLFSILVEKKEYSLFGIRKKQLLILDERKLFIRYSESCNFQLIRQPFPKGENNNETDHSLTYTRATLTFTFPGPCKNSCKFAIKETISTRVGSWCRRAAQRADRATPISHGVTRFQQLFIFISEVPASCKEQFFQDGSRVHVNLTKKKKKKKEKKGKVREK